jgi:hypothetical protein
LNQWLTLAANLGVIAGIVFLGLEIQQNNAVSMSQVYQARMDSRRELVILGMAQDMSAILQKASSPSYANLNDLSEVERRQVRQLNTLWMAWWDNLIYQESLGLIEPEDVAQGDLEWFDSLLTAWQKLSVEVHPRILDWRERRRQQEDAP